MRTLESVVPLRLISESQSLEVTAHFPLFFLSFLSLEFSFSSSTPPSPFSSDTHSLLPFYFQLSIYAFFLFVADKATCV
jgi:hypothetical protein